MIFAAIATIATVSGIAGFNVNFRTNESSDLTLADVGSRSWMGRGLVESSGLRLCISHLPLHHVFLPQ